MHAGMMVRWLAWKDSKNYKIQFLHLILKWNSGTTQFYNLS